MSELTTAQASEQLGIQVSGVDKLTIVNTPDGKVQLTNTSNQPLQFTSSPTDPKSYVVTSGGGNDIVEMLGTGNHTVDLGGGNNTARFGDGNNTAKAGSGNDTLIFGNGNNFVEAGSGANTISMGTGQNTLQYNAGDLGSSSGPRELNVGDAMPLRGGRGGTFGRASERDRITGFSTDDVLRISKAALPGAKLRNGRLRRTDFAVVEGRGAVNRSNAAIVYDSKSGGLFYNPQGPARPVEIFRMDSGLDLTRNNIVIF